MKRLFFILLAVSTASSLLSAQQNSSASEKQDSVNSAVVAARAATKEKRYADAEALMLKVTSDKPQLVIPWVELGLAQLGLKKYSEAENSFKTALGIDPASQERAHSDDFYQLNDKPGTVAPFATHASRNTVGHDVGTGQNRPPDVLGTCYASLGEIYIHQGKVADAKASFDNAVKANPPQAASYRSNEAIFFFDAGNADEQLAAAEQALALDPNRALMYYFKAQALAAKATIDPQTQKMVLPPGCIEAYRKYLQLEPNGQFAADAKGILAAAGAPAK
jgi:tetratricopeptide (TPR) repeat protein